MTRKNTLAFGAALLACLGALVAAPMAVADSSDQLPSPDTYLHQIGSEVVETAPVTSADAGDQLPSPDTYLHQIGSEVVETAPAPSADAGDAFDWRSAMIGAAVGAGLAALLAGSLALISLRRRTPEVTAPVS
jgi:hypothetical protein